MGRNSRGTGKIQLLTAHAIGRFAGVKNTKQFVKHFLPRCFIVHLMFNKILTYHLTKVKLLFSSTLKEVTPMPIVKTSAKGQIVIPAAIRKKLKIKPGQKVNLTLVEDKAVITPLPEDPIKSLRGILKGKPSMTRALLEDRKKEVEREEKDIARLLRRSRLAPK